MLSREEVIQIEQFENKMADRNRKKGQPNNKWNTEFGKDQIIINKPHTPVKKRHLGSTETLFARIYQLEEDIRISSEDIRKMKYDIEILQNYVDHLRVGR